MRETDKQNDSGENTVKTVKEEIMVIGKKCLQIELEDDSNTEMRKLRKNDTKRHDTLTRHGIHELQRFNPATFHVRLTCCGVYVLRKF